MLSLRARVNSTVPPEAPICIEVAGSPLALDGPAGLQVAEGTTLGEALEALGFRAEAMPGLGIWGRRAGPETVLQDGDRLECYCRLEVDPRAARRARASKR